MIKIYYLLIVLFLVPTTLSSQCLSKDYTPSKRLVASLINGGDIDITSIKKGCNDDAVLRKELLNALQRKTDLRRLDSLLNIRTIYDYNDYILNNVIKRRIESSGNSFTDSTFFIEKDKFISQKRFQYYKELTINKPIQSGIIKVIGFLHIKEALPILKKMYLEKDTRVDTNYLLFTLARMDRSYFEKINTLQYQPKNNLDDSDWIDDFNIKSSILTFLGYQESIYKIVSFLDTDKYYQFSSNGSEARCSAFVLTCLSELILNKEFALLTSFLKDDRTGKNKDYPLQLEKCKKWLNDNQGKYIISDNFGFVF